ncbi:double-strand break repair helicase AddA [Sneathiella limimaris]|uniref:double-strand break repair helicase AddA n=1 Tax=Sneathiella limimaris TaxID=1964213 RepID=UPI00146E907E|nr:double-strand break repair helicase AddA [Sneathiella limimaris]
MTSSFSSMTLAGIKAQQQAANPTHSVWVSASAGSGKTRVLVDRTLRLMLGGTAPERILCITFTKAAAAEMANRLNKTLGDWSVKDEAELIVAIEELQGYRPSPEEVTRARQLFANVLDAPGGLKIQTIHSFCGSVLARFPLEAGISPNFQELDDRTASEIMEVCRDRLLSHSQGPGEEALKTALQIVSEKINEQDFSDLMLGLSSRRGRFKRFFQSAQDINGAVQHIADLLGADQNLTEEEILQKASDETAFDATSLRQAVEVLNAGGKRDQDNAARMSNWLANPQDRSQLFEDYLKAYLTAEGKRKADSTLASKASVSAMPDILEVMRAEAERLLDILDQCRRIRVLSSTKAMLVLGRWLLDEYEREKTRRGALDFDDLILTTRDLLSQQDVTPWVMYKLDGGIDHILVDEAQDTSPEQWEVIKALTAEFFSGDTARDQGRTLFVVGDEKQSIYSFQGADPAAFDYMRRLFEKKAGVADKSWQQVPMELSFRSTHAVLSLVDEVFAREEARSGVTFGAEQVRHFIHRMDQIGHTEIWPVVKPEPREDEDPWEIPVDQGFTVSPPAKLADNIAVQIKDWMSRGEILASANRPIAPKDIMILVQSRNALFDELVRALKSHAIPVAGADRMRLTEQLAVLDLIALGRFVLLPEDDLNLASLLKSPFCGLDDMDLFDLAYGRKGSLWSALQDKAGSKKRYADAVEFLKNQLSRADFVPVYEFYAEILGRDQGRRKLLSRLGEEALDPIEEFLSLALTYQKSETSSLQGFLHWVQSGGAEIKRDMEQGRNEVRILTVHGSKGLQAPIVFLPDTCQRSAPPRSSQVIWAEGDVATPLWPVRKENFDQFTAGVRDRLKARTEEEKRRLLYVALTRAEDRLYICGWENKQSRPSGCWYDLVDMAFSDGSDHPIEEVELPFGGVARRRTSGTVVNEKKVVPETSEFVPSEALPEWITKPPAAEPFPPQPLTPSREDEEPPVRSPLGTDDGHRFHRGLIIHRLLESLPAVLPANRVETARNWLARPTHGLSEHQQQQILEETMRVLDHPEFGEIFGPGSKAEVPVTALMGDRIMSGQIDRLLIGEEEILIVDYKTNRPSPTDIGDVPSVYLRQMEIYRTALKKLYPEKRIKCGLLWTDGPHMMSLPDT